MEAYQDFAYVYDEFMDATPYAEWCDRICKLISKYGVSKPERNVDDVLDSEKNLVVDLGCGTGTLTSALYQKGYDMIGVDNFTRNSYKSWGYDQIFNLLMTEASNQLQIIHIKN